MKRKLRRIFMPIAGILLLTILFAVKAEAQSEPAVTTDQSDYPPGATVYISGTGFYSGESVTLQVVHIDNFGDNTAPQHQPWKITADPDGNFMASWYIPEDQDEFGATLKLTADGDSSLLHAETIFTDAVTITVNGANPPPATVTACQGTSITFTSNLSNVLLLFSYQWQVNTGSGFVNIPNANLSSYTINPVTGSSAGIYRVSVSALIGGGNSNPVTLIVPVTTGVTICQGGSASPLTSSTVCQDETPVSSGQRNANTAANISIGSNTDWSNPTNITSTGSPYATVPLSPGANSDYLQGTNYNFNIPLNANIKGIQVSINRTGQQSLGVGFRDNAVYLVKNVSGSPVVQTSGSNKALSATWSTSFVAANYGSTTDLWNLSWTPQDINSSNFGVALSVHSNLIFSSLTATVDYVQINVTYALPGDLNWYTVSSGGSIVQTGPSFNPINNPEVLAAGAPYSNLSNTNTPGTYTFYVECSSAPGCRTPADFVIQPTQTLTEAVQHEAVCAGFSAVIDLAGLLANTTSTINYSINGVAQTPVTGVFAGALGTASFTTANLTAADNGQNLQITGITITSAAPACTKSFEQDVELSVNTAPVITQCQSNINVSNDPGKCGSSQSFGVTVTGSPAPVVTYKIGGNVITSPHVFPVGTTTVTVEASNTCGTETCSFTVTVTDNEQPFVSPAANVSVNNDPGVCYATVNLTNPVTNDNCGVQSVTNNHPSTSYPVGTTTVTWTVTDIHGKINTAQQTVTVTDNEAPSVTPAANVIVNNNPGVCGAAVSLSAPATGDNCGVFSVTNNHPLTNYPVGTTIVIWTVTDIHGNSTNAAQTVTVIDNEAPVVPVIAVAKGECGVTVTAPVATDNCAVQVTGTTSDPLSYTAQGDYVIHWTFSDGNGNSSTTTQDVKVHDVTDPIINCPGSTFVRNANYSDPACSYEVNGSEFDPTFSDNCSGSTISNSFNGLGTLAGAILENGTTNIEWTVTDVGGNTATCTITVEVSTNLSVTSTNSNPILYFGYSGDQSATYKVVPSGGTAPYKITFTMDRPLKCNQVNDAGDEKWIANGTNITTGTGCPAYPDSLNGPDPRSIITAAPYSVTVTLLADAVLYAVVEDANHCTVIDSTVVTAEDVRCFAGGKITNPVKVQLCHKTGSTKNPCVTICVDDDAVAEHIAHGDTYGVCPKIGCGTTSSNTSPIAVSQTLDNTTGRLQVNISPNPGVRGVDFVLTAKSNVKEQIEIRVLNMLGQQVYRTKGEINQTYRFGSEFRGGTYFIQVVQGKSVKIVQVIKQ